MSTESPAVAPLCVDRKTAAALLGLAPKTLANQHVLGIGPPVVYVGTQSPRYLLEDIHAYLRSRRVAHSTEGDARGLTSRSLATRISNSDTE